MTTQTEQLEAFPKTTMEVLESLRAFHVADLEKAGTALENLGDDEKIARRYEKAEERLADARGLVSDIDRAIAELRKMDGGKSVAQVAADIVNSGALNTDDIQVTASVTPADFTDEVAAELDAMAAAGEVAVAVDPITGEVAERYDRICQDCGGDGRLDDRTGGGHHKCRTCDGTGKIAMERPASPVVFVFYPGDDEPHVTEVGEKTRYGELVHDYFTAAGLNGKHDAKDWTVVAKDELTTTGGARKLRDIIGAGDYGKRLLVVAADQGSATGVTE